MRVPGQERETRRHRKDGSSKTPQVPGFEETGGFLPLSWSMMEFKKVTSKEQGLVIWGCFVLYGTCIDAGVACVCARSFRIALACAKFLTGS